MYNKEKYFRFGGREMNEKEKVISLYSYIADLSNSSRKIMKDVHEEKFTYFLDQLPKHPYIQYYGTYEEEREEILEIRKPSFQSPLPLEEKYLEWIEGEWENYKSVIEIQVEKTWEEKNEETGELVSKIEKIPTKIETKLVALLEERELWRKAQKEIEEVRTLFDDLYKRYLDLGKESETIELILANGLVKIPSEKIYYPILCKKVKLVFLAEENILQVRYLGLDELEGTQFYTDFLNDLTSIHLGMVLDLGEKVKEKEYHPLDRTEVDLFFREFIHSLSSQGQYTKDMEEGAFVEKDAITIEDRPLLFIRKKENGVAKSIQEIIQNIEEKEEIPEQLLELVGLSEEKMEELREQEKEKAEEEILFVKESNAEQFEIAKKIQNHRAVIVQGPPGTGKTHTIANLLGNFLSQGKNVLVTSQTKKALKVLKDKIPKDIQGLCISILDDDNSDMARSVQEITDKMGRLSSSDLQREIANLEAKRKEELKDLEGLKEKIYAIQKQENQKLSYEGESFSIREAGEYVRDEEERLGKITGEIPTEISCPISQEEWDFLQACRESLSKETEKELEGKPFDFSLKSQEELETLLSKITEAKQKFEVYLVENQIQSVEQQLKFEDKASLDLKTFFKRKENVELIPKKLQNLEKWSLEIMKMGLNQNSLQPLFKQFLKELKYHFSLQKSETMKFFGKTFDYSSVGEAKKLVLDLKEAILNPGFLFLKGKLQKVKENIGRKVLLNAAPLESIEDCDLFLDYLQVEERKEDLKRKWSSFPLEDISLEDLFQHGVESLDLLESYFTWYSEERDSFIQVLRMAGIEARFFQGEETNRFLGKVFDDFPEQIKVLEKLIGAGVLVEAFEKTETEYHAYCHRFESLARESSLLDQDLVEALAKKDVERYAKNLEERRTLEKKREAYNRRESILDKIEEVAEDWAKALRKEEKTEFGLSVSKLWKWKQISQKLEEMAKEPYEKYQAEALQHKERIKQLTLELVNKKSWYHVLSFVEQKDNLLINQALRGWKQSMEKIGKGTGKNANMYRKQAKEKIAYCQKAVPVWIMPMNKVIDTLNPGKNKFDIVIIDEASQSDVTALLLLYMAKKVIVVGDDKQVSPAAVAEKIETQNALQEKYLRNKIPNSDLYDKRASLYSIATTTYQPLMLREHFRCVPEIIAYSNKTSYDYKIKPLRESNSTLLKPAVISYAVPGKREENKKVNVLEAETIVALIQACLEEEVYQSASFGVMSLLGGEQVELIQNLLVQRLGNAVVEKHQILCGDPSHFQGDERNVIFLSMVDSNDQEGEAPLRKTAEGTENLNKKKYNVAVSRAKDQLWVVHSLDRARDLKEGDIRKELLDFASDPKSFFPEEEKKKKSDSALENEVAKYLSDRNYQVAQEWEVGAYQIDMIVSYQGKRIAVECDGESIYATEEELKREQERQEILERCGWKFIRIRASKYFRNPEATMEEVLASLEKNGIFPKKEGENTEEERGNSLIERIQKRSLEVISTWKEEDEKRFPSQETAEKEEVEKPKRRGRKKKEESQE